MRKRLSNEISLYTVEILKEIFYNSSPRVACSLPETQMYSAVFRHCEFYSYSVSSSRFSIIYTIVTKDRLDGQGALSLQRLQDGSMIRHSYRNVVTDFFLLMKVINEN